jgi:DNA repair photolyase
MAAAGLHAGVLVTPVIPGLTVTELESVLEAAAASGAGYADYAMLSMPVSERQSFASWLLRNCPERSRVVTALLDAIRLDEPATASSRAPDSLPPSYRELFERRFDVACRRFLLDRIPAPRCCGRFQIPAASFGRPSEPGPV